MTNMSMMPYNKIKLFISHNKRHWESYPFISSVHNTIDQELLRYNINVIKNKKDADIELLCMPKPDEIGSQTPTIIIECKDDPGICAATRKIINEQDNVIVWKWGKYHDNSIYDKTNTTYAKRYYFDIQPPKIKINPDKILTSFNTMWDNDFYNIRSHRKIKKPIDIAFIGTIATCGDITRDTFKLRHRKQCIQALNKLPNDISRVIIHDRIEKEDYCRILSQTKICISPWGNCEFCGRDIQGLTHDCVVIKPKTTDTMETWPDVWKDAIECKHDFSDIQYITRTILSDWNNMEPITREKGKYWRSIQDNRQILIERIAHLIWQSIDVIKR